MFNRARRDISTMATLLPAAESAARAEGLVAASAEHLVLAALDLPDGTAAGSLREAALPEPVPARGPLRTDPSAQALFERVRRMAKKDGVPIAGAHVVLAACELRHGVLVRALDLLGVDREALVAAARGELAGEAR